MESSEFSYLKSVRHHLHKHPEASGKEEKTASYIVSELEKTDPDQLHKGVGGHGIIAVYGRDSGGERLMFRSELDALPIDEQGERPYKSTHGGFSHACGHDGHMSVMLGVARYLKMNRPEKGQVMILFQPSEETGKGAERMIADPVFRRLSPDRSYAFHNLPGFSKGKVYIRENTFASASVGLQLTFTGVSSHAAYPEQGRNPAQAVSALIRFAGDAGVRDIADENYSIATVTYIRMGEKAFGISPARAEVGLTLRAAGDETMDRMQQDIRREAEGKAGQHGLQLDIAESEPFAATVNSDECISVIRQSAEKSGTEAEELDHPFPWSEDFGHFGRVSRIGLFGIGSGENHPHLHAEEFDFSDEIIGPAVKLFLAIIRQELNA
ncbi:MAG: amidohydrolase [Balneolaceae bacterium]